MPLEHRKFQLFALSVYFLRIVCTYWNKNLYTDLSQEYLGQVWFGVRSHKFWHIYAPWTFLQFQFIIFTEVKGTGEGKGVSQTFLVYICSWAIYHWLFFCKARLKKQQTIFKINLKLWPWKVFDCQTFEIAILSLSLFRCLEYMYGDLDQLWKETWLPFPVCLILTRSSEIFGVADGKD